jgi:N-acetylglucosaminyl-diphospho-decaprenol L-rhamnosyltransferase
VIVHWGNSGPTVEVVLRYCRERYFTNIAIIANDLQPCPKELHDSAVSWIVPSRNLGFGGGCNLGARRYPASKYVFLNADVTFHANAITMCLQALDLPGVGIAAPTLYFPDGSLQSGCGSISRYLKVPRIDRLPDRPVTECDWVTGASLFCRHEVLESVGFDGSYFLGFEDLDIGHRARLSGWKVVVLAGATATHPARTSLNGARPAYYATRNQIWFFRRHWSFLSSFTITLYVLRLIPRVILADIVRRRSSHAMLMFRGLIAGWRNIPTTKEPLLEEPIPSRWIDWNRS